MSVRERIAAMLLIGSVVVFVAGLTMLAWHLTDPTTATAVGFMSAGITVGAIAVALAVGPDDEGRT